MRTPLVFSCTKSKPRERTRATIAGQVVANGRLAARELDVNAAAGLLRACRASRRCRRGWRRRHGGSPRRSTPDRRDRSATSPRAARSSFAGDDRDRARNRAGSRARPAWRRPTGATRRAAPGPSAIGIRARARSASTIVAVLGAGLAQIDDVALGDALGGDRRETDRADALGEAEGQSERRFAAGHKAASIAGWSRAVSRGGSRRPMRASIASRIASASAYRRLTPASASDRWRNGERRREAGLQRDAGLALNELVGQIDHRALVKPSFAVEGDRHGARPASASSGKPNRADHRGAGFGVMRPPLAMSCSQRGRARRSGSIGSPAALQPPGDVALRARRPRGHGGESVRASPPPRASSRIPTHPDSRAAPTPPASRR